MESSLNPKMDENSPAVVQPMSSMFGKLRWISSSIKRWSKLIPAKTIPAWGFLPCSCCWHWLITRSTALWVSISSAWPRLAKIICLYSFFISVELTNQSLFTAEYIQPGIIIVQCCQGDVEVGSQLHGQRCWAGMGQDNRNARTGGFLDQFIADTG